MATSRNDSNTGVTMSFYQKRHRLLLGISTCAALISLYGTVHAEDFVVNSVTTVPNGGNTIGAGDRLTITPDGQINTTGENAVEAAADGVAITNNGGLSVTGPGGEGIFVNDDNAVTNNGKLTTDGPGSDAIDADDDNVIVNAGSIETFGPGSEGIDVDNRNRVTNAGSIVTRGPDSSGIEGTDSNSVTNTGSIETRRTGGQGIDLNDGNSVINAGSITTNGRFADGIDVEDDNVEVTNSGAITTNRFNADGIDIGSRNDNVNNSGSITTNGVFSAGIEMDRRNTVNSTGTIQTSRRFSAGILALGGRNSINVSGTIQTRGFLSSGIATFGRRNTIDVSGGIDTQGFASPGIASFGLRNTVNVSGSVETSGGFSPGILIGGARNSANISGKIVSANGPSFLIEPQFGPFRNRLNLVAPAFLGGAIIAPGTNISIITGASHSVLWDFSDSSTPNISGPVPWAYNAATRQFATFDPTVFGAAGDILADSTDVLSQITQGRLNSTSAGTPGAAEFGYLNRDGNGSPTNVWVQGIGLTSSYGADGILTDYDFDLVGVAAGFDGIYADGLTLGVLGGYYHGDLDSDSAFTSSYNNDTENWFAGVYGRKTIDKHFIGFGLNGGFQNVDQSRFVNDNLALTNGQTLGNAWANSSYDSWFINPEIAVGTEVHQYNGWSIVPTARARYAIQFIDGYSETGSNANATVGSQQVQIAEGRLELAASKVFQTGHARVYGGYLARGSFGDDAVGVNLVGQDILVPTGEDTFQSVGYLGSQMVFNITSGLGLQVGSQFAFGSDFTSLSGNIGLKSKF